MSPRTSPQRKRPQGGEGQDMCTLQHGVWPPTHRMGGPPAAPRLPNVHGRPFLPSTGRTLATCTRGTMSSLWGQASQQFVKAAASCEGFFYLSPVSFLTGCFWRGETGRKRANSAGETWTLQLCRVLARALGDPERGVPTGQGRGAAGHGVFALIP